MGDVGVRVGLDEGLVMEGAKYCLDGKHPHTCGLAALDMEDLRVEVKVSDGVSVRVSVRVYRDLGRGFIRK